jgi:hypothetical protein
LGKYGFLFRFRGGLESTACSLGLSATSQQYFSLRTNQPPATSRNQPAVIFSQNKPAPAISHQPTEQAANRTGSAPELHSNETIGFSNVLNFAHFQQSNFKSFLFVTVPRRLSNTNQLDH